MMMVLCMSVITIIIDFKYFDLFVSTIGTKAIPTEYALLDVQFVCVCDIYIFILHIATYRAIA